MDNGCKIADKDSHKQAQEVEETMTKRGPLQNIAVFVAALCALSFVEGISVNGLAHINLSNLETRFELTSKQAGLISSSGEVGAISLVLFVSFYGGRSHRPRVTAGGGFLLALGTLLFLLPHIIIGPYSYSLDTDMSTTCRANRTSSCEREISRGSASRFLPVFMAGQAIQGIGFTPVFTCGFAYIDDHATSEKTAVYLGLTYAITALGVGVGYVVGGQFLSLWVDTGRTDTSVITITNSDKRWVGAWWIGYVMCSVLFFVISLFLCCFPRFMPGSKQRLRESKDSTISNTGPEIKAPKPKTIVELILSFPKALLELVENPLYILLVLVGTGDTLIVSGIAGFAPKIIEEKFSVKPTQSGLIMGAVTLAGGAGGMALGGFIIQRFHLRLMGILKMCLGFILAGAILGGGCFFIHCPQERFAGINSDYGLAVQHSPASTELTAKCNTDCSCDTHVFEPVCGEDGITYFSPCYAGCPKKTLTNCSCIRDTLRNGGKAGNGSAVNGQCDTPCPQVWPFVFVMFLGILFTFLTVTPISMAILRCVPQEDRSVGLGLQWVTLRLLGTIPGPILTGAVLDSACELWQNTCSGRGSCWVYDRTGMSLRLFLWWVAVKVTSLFFLWLAYSYYKKRGHAEVERQEYAQNISLPEQSGRLKSAESSLEPETSYSRRHRGSRVDAPGGKLVVGTESGLAQQAPYSQQSRLSKADAAGGRLGMNSDRPGPGPEQETRDRQQSRESEVDAAGGRLGMDSDWPGPGPEQETLDRQQSRESEVDCPGYRFRADGGGSNPDSGPHASISNPLHSPPRFPTHSLREDGGGSSPEPGPHASSSNPLYTPPPSPPTDVNLSANGWGWLGGRGGNGDCRHGQAGGEDGGCVDAEDAVELDVFTTVEPAVPHLLPVSRFLAFHVAGHAKDDEVNEPTAGTTTTTTITTTASTTITTTASTTITPSPALTFSSVDTPNNNNTNDLTTTTSRSDTFKITDDPKDDKVDDLTPASRSVTYKIEDVMSNDVTNVDPTTTSHFATFPEMNTANNHVTDYDVTSSDDALTNVLINDVTDITAIDFGATSDSVRSRNTTVSDAVNTRL